MEAFSQRSVRGAEKPIDERGYKMLIENFTIGSRCDKCGSEKLRLEYQIRNRNTHFISRDFFCVECGHISQLKEYLDDPDCQYRYYVSYSQRHNISDSYEQFTDKVTQYLKNQVVGTALKDEKDTVCKCWGGYIDEQEIIQFLRW